MLVIYKYKEKKKKGENEREKTESSPIRHGCHRFVTRNELLVGIYQSKNLFFFVLFLPLASDYAMDLADLRQP